MAKTNKAEIIKLCNEINKKEGEGSIYSIGSKHANLKINRWSTGIEDLDVIIGGGMPEGRVVEIFGPESSGKTTLLYHLCGLHNMCLDIPIEGTFDSERAKVFGNRPKQMLIYRAKYGEDAFEFNYPYSYLRLINFYGQSKPLTKRIIRSFIWKEKKRSPSRKDYRGGIAIMKKLSKK